MVHPPLHMAITGTQTLGGTQSPGGKGAGKQAGVVGRSGGGGLQVLQATLMVTALAVVAKELRWSWGGQCRDGGA